MPDTIRIDAPAAQAELEFLNNAKIGDVRTSMLMPSLSCEVKWMCVKHVTTPKRLWVWEGSVFGQLLMRVEIEETDGALTLTEKE